MLCFECLEWFKKRTILEKALLPLSSILLLTLLIMILIGATYHGKNTNPLNDETSCWSKECVQTAGDVLKSLDTGADVCRNFYDYACGKYGQEPGQTVPVARHSTDSVYFALKGLMESQRMFDIQGLDDVRSFYNICVTFGSLRQDVKDTRKELFSVMRGVGVDIFPVLDSQYELSDWTEGRKLERFLASLTLLDVPVAFRMEVVPDRHIDGHYLVKISPGRPRETGRTEYDIRGDSRLQSSVLASIILMGSTSGRSDVNDILAVDGRLADITEQDKNTTCDVVSLAPQEAASELRRLFPDFHWDVLLSEIRNKSGLDRPFAVELHCKQKISDSLEYLDNVLERSLTNYLGWRLLSAFEDIVIPNFEKSLFGTGERVARWRLCLEHMEQFSSPVLGDLLSREMVDKSVQEEVERISDASLTAAKLLVSRATWLTDVQRSRIADKVSKIRINYPYKRQSGDAAQIVIPKADVANFTQVVIHRKREEVIQRFRRLNRGTQASRQTISWMPVLTEVNNFAYPDLTAYIYFDKIRNPYVRQQGSQWMNYGGFGLFIAREISRVLASLNAGVGHDEKDLVWNVWAQKSTSNPCLHGSMFSPRIEGKRSQTFLDHSALEIAYEAAKSAAVSSKSLPGLDFSNEEFFFVSYAQTNCKAEKMEQSHTREWLNATLFNFKSFREVFNCEFKDACQIWA